jgi:serine/threonine protein kinase
MPVQNNSSLPEGLEVGGYQIVKKISSGGFSIVYLATDEGGQSVAIKEYMPAALATRKAGELSPYVSPESLNTYRIGLKCFFEEGRALASIYHPNIVRVLNFFRANDTVYMVMNYESGRSLQEHVIRNRSKEQKDVLSERFIRRVFAQVMNGLREVHSNRLLHLDATLPRAIRCTRPASRRPSCTSATPNWAHGRTFTPSAPAFTPACRECRRRRATSA